MQNFAQFRDFSSGERHLSALSPSFLCWLGGADEGDIIDFSHQIEKHFFTHNLGIFSSSSVHLATTTTTVSSAEKHLSPLSFRLRGIRSEVTQKKRLGVSPAEENFLLPTQHRNSIFSGTELANSGQVAHWAGYLRLGDHFFAGFEQFFTSFSRVISLFYTEHELFSTKAVDKL